MKAVLHLILVSNYLYDNCVLFLWQTLCGNLLFVFFCYSKLLFGIYILRIISSLDHLFTELFDVYKSEEKFGWILDKP
jgi:hypothetical protein